MDVDSLISIAGGELLFWFPEVNVAAARAIDTDFADRVAASATVVSVGAAGQWMQPQTVIHRVDFDLPTATDDLYAFYQWDIRRVHADLAWADGVTGSHDTVVSVIDTGVDSSHPDLAPNVVYQACMQLAGPCPPFTLTGEHGTHVAGTVAAAFDGGRVVGVGPNLGIAGYQVFENGGGAWDPVIWWAMIDTAFRGYEVINMSLGGYYQFPQTEGDGAAVWTAWNRIANFVTRMGVTIVASAGNGGVNVNGPLYHIPGDLPAILNVGATGIQPDPFYPQEDFFDIPAFYTNYGAAVDLVAPGGDCGIIDNCIDDPPVYPWYWYLVMSTVPGGYAWMGGTSMAAPHVAGAAGLIMDENPRLNPGQVKAILTRTADKIGSRLLFGHGMLDVQDAAKVAGK